MKSELFIFLFQNFIYAKDCIDIIWFIMEIIEIEYYNNFEEINKF